MNVALLSKDFESDRMIACRYGSSRMRRMNSHSVRTMSFWDNSRRMKRGFLDNLRMVSDI